MDYDEVVMGRRSIRGYKKEPVPKDLIREIVQMAGRAPSSMNTQPWHFHVVTGEPLDRIREGNTERNMACLLYTSPSPRDRTRSRMPSSA